MPPSLRRKRLQSPAPSHFPAAHAYFRSPFDLLQSACSTRSSPTEQWNSQGNTQPLNLAHPGRWQAVYLGAKKASHGATGLPNKKLSGGG